MKFIDNGDSHILFGARDYCADPFSTAIGEGDIELLSVILEAFKEKGINIVKILAENGENPLCYAAEKGRLELFQLIFENYNSMIDGNDDGFNLIRVADASRFRALHNAVRGKSIELVRYILDNGGVEDIVTENSYGHTPIDATITLCNYNILEIFAQYAKEYK